MAGQINSFDDLGALAQTVQEDANFVVRETMFVDTLIKNFSDRLGMGKNTRTRNEFNESTMNDVGEQDDLTSQAFTPSAQEILTPAEIGSQFLITDPRRDSEAPENLLSDAAMELGLAGADKISQKIYALFPSLTGGTVGAAGTTLTWGHLMAAISRCRVSIGNNSIPMVAVLHEYHYQRIAKAASVAGATSIAQAPEFTEEVQRNYWVARAYNTDIYTSPSISIDSSDDAYAAVFARDAMGIDWRTSPTVEPERDASRRATELNYTALFAAGVWRPTWGVQLLGDASEPAS